jgi:hypothetical protein
LNPTWYLLKVIFANTLPLCTKTALFKKKFGTLEPLQKVLIIFLFLNLLKNVYLYKL